MSGSAAIKVFGRDGAVDRHPGPASDGVATFVMPHLADHPLSAEFLRRAIDGLEKQTDENWNLVIVDDASETSGCKEQLFALRDERPSQIHVIMMESRRGPGVCRNAGIRWAAEQGSAIILFNDADDVSHPRRVAVSRERLLADGAACEFIYSPIIVVDENDTVRLGDDLPPSTAEIIEAHVDPPVGPRAWVDIATRTGYATVTSTVGITTSLAVRTAFPDVPFSEDSHAWFRMMASGNGAVFERSIPSRYRIPRDARDHRHRDRVGPECNRHKLTVDTDGFLQALAIGLTTGVIHAAELPELKRRFFERLRATMQREGEADLAADAAVPASEYGFGEPSAGGRDDVAQRGVRP